jgi:hypothetical protein
MASRTADVQSPSAGCLTVSADPFEDGRSVIVLQHDDPAAACDGQHLAGRGDAIADRRDQRHVVGLGADQGRRGHAGALVLAGLEAFRQRPWLALAADRGAPGFLGGQRQRAPGGGIEETDLARHVEQRALARQHDAISLGRQEPSMPCARTNFSSSCMSMSRG